MRRYLSTLACSGLLSIVALYGIPAFAGSIPGSIPDIAPTVDAADEAFRTLPAQPTTADSAWNLTCVTNCGPRGLQSAVLLRSPGDPRGGVQFVRGGGGGGGSHGGGSHGGGGMGGSHGGGGFHERHFAHGDRFHNNNGGGGAFYGFGLYPYCNPYYGPCYPGYYPEY